MAKVNGSSTGNMAVPAMELKGTVFPSTLSPPGSCKTFFLGGAGIRGVHIDGQFKVFTLCGVYMEPEAISFLTKRWQGKSVEQLYNSKQFFQDIFTGPFDKLSQVTLVEHLGGKRFARTVAEHCTKILQNKSTFTGKEQEAMDQLVDIFETMELHPGFTIFFTYCNSGHLRVAFSKDSSVPEAEHRVIECQNLTQSILESIIGESGVSPAAKLSIASRMHQIMNNASAASPP